MPWQSLSSMVVIIGMFNVAAALTGGIHYLAYGVRRRKYKNMETEWRRFAQIAHCSWYWYLKLEICTTTSSSSG